MATTDAEEKLVQWKMYQSIYWFRRGYINMAEALAQFSYWSGLTPEASRLLFDLNRKSMTLADLAAFKYRPRLDPAIFTPRVQSPGKLRPRRKRARAADGSCT